MIVRFAKIQLVDHAIIIADHIDGTRHQDRLAGGPGGRQPGFYCAPHPDGDRGVVAFTLDGGGAADTSDRGSPVRVMAGWTTRLELP